MNHQNLYQFANVRQLEILEAIDKYGSARQAALALNLCKSTVTEHLNNVKKKADLAGTAPEIDIAVGLALSGTSTYYNKDGKVTAQWVKTKEDRQRQANVAQQAIAAAIQELPRLASVPKPEFVAESLCNVYTLTDSHVGMLAWHKEGGVDWDLAIAEKTLTGCFEALVQQSPAAKNCVIAQLGDYLHYDGLEAVTPTSKHIVDADGRFGKMVGIAIRILRNLVDHALQRHEHVTVLIAEGNHDMASSVWLRLMFTALYENEPRLTVIDSELPYYIKEHGKTLLAWHHGHLSKNDRLPLLFAAEYPQSWGRTIKRYAHVGHRHHVEIKEHSGMTVVQHSTLAARDAYAARGGWTSERQITGYTYHSDYGQVASTTISPEMLEIV